MLSIELNKKKLVKHSKKYYKFVKSENHQVMSYNLKSKLIEMSALISIIILTGQQLIVSGIPMVIC